MTVATDVAALQAKLAASANAFNDIFVSFIGADLDAAIALANSKNDAAGAACWATIKSLAPPAITPGAGLATLIQYGRSLVSQQGAVNTNCGAVLPSFVLAFNQMVSALIQIGNTTLPTAALGAVGAVASAAPAAA